MSLSTKATENAPYRHFSIDFDLPITNARGITRGQPRTLYWVNDSGRGLVADCATSSVIPLRIKHTRGKISLIRLRDVKGTSSNIIDCPVKDCVGPDRV